MSIWPKKPTVCEVCRLYFEPDTDPTVARWQHLCPTHRGPVMARDLLHDKVMQWAEENWESLVHHVANTDPKLLPLVEQAKEIIHLPDGKKLLE